MSRLGAIRAATVWVAPRLSFVAFGTVTTFCVWYWVVTPFPPEKDWRLFHDIGRLVLGGRMAEVYPGITPELPFLYPPFFVWQVAPLGLLSRGLACLAVLIATICATALSLWALRTALDRGKRPVERWLWILLCSEPWRWTVMAVHISGWYLLLLSAALLLWVRERHFWAGIVLSLMLTKPNYGLIILLCVVVGRAWTVVAGAITGLSLLVLSTVPLGSRIWLSFWIQVRGIPAVLEDSPEWKQITLQACWRSLLGQNRTSWATVAWIGTTLPCLLLVLRAWRKAGPTSEDAPRLLGLSVL